GIRPPPFRRNAPEDSDSGQRRHARGDPLRPGAEGDAGRERGEAPRSFDPRCPYRSLDTRDEGQFLAARPYLPRLLGRPRPRLLPRGRKGRPCRGDGPPVGRRGVGGGAGRPPDTRATARKRRAAPTPAQPLRPRQGASDPVVGGAPITPERAGIPRSLL